jgi:serine phosphatase RsbU (regulator of sigma subunit)
MSTSAVIREINSINASIPPIIETLEGNKARLETSIADADSNWNDHKKEEFFGGPITTVRQAYLAQIQAMQQVKQAFASGESTIFSLV